MTTTDDISSDPFASVIYTELLERTKKNMELMTPEKKPSAPLPFAMSPYFLEIYPEVIRLAIFPIVFSRRPVRAMRTHVDWAKEGRDPLNVIMDERSNAIFAAWDAAWDSLWDDVKPEKQTGPVKKEEKGGFLGSLFGRKESKAKVVDKTHEEAPPVAIEGLLPMLTLHAHKRGYLPLAKDDVRILKGMIRVKPPKIRDAWKEITQYHNQEFMFQGKEASKPGVFAEALGRWQVNLPDRIGEFLVLKAAVDLPCCNKTFLTKYIRGLARSQDDAERSVPYLTAYLKAMSNTIPR
ncbi:DUF4123 domain-containing protein [Azospirillaceae bacterium]